MHRIAFIYLLNDSGAQKRPSAGRGSDYRAASVVYRFVAMVGDLAAALTRGPWVQRPTVPARHPARMPG